MKWVLLFLIPAACICSASIDKHLVKIASFSQMAQVEHIDCIYLINLDTRPEKLRACIEQLTEYHIDAHRISAVVGKEISEQVMKDVGMKFNEGMAFFIGKLRPGATQLYFFNERMYGQTCFYKDFSKGALGCTLSHLSILKHAYDHGYETIWILEDDFLINRDPHILSQYIEQLDEWIGEENWDILHTDDFSYFTGFGDRWRPDYKKIGEDVLKERPELYQEYVTIGDSYADAYQKIHSWWVKRMKKSLKNYGMTRAYPDLHPDFRYVTGRYHTHSMIIRRSGIKKILDFERRYGIFLPYDDELSVIPFLKMFNLKSNVVTLQPEVISDT